MKQLLLGLPIPENSDPSTTADIPEFVNMFRGGENDDGEMGNILNHLIKDREEYDGYYIYAELVNQYIQIFPEMKDTWETLSTKQKWWFIEGLFYGILPRIHSVMGYKQV